MSLGFALTQCLSVTAESIVGYLHRAEQLAWRLPTAADTVGYNVVRGMKDTAQKERETFECIKDHDYSLVKGQKGDRSRLSDD